ncbi:MAG: membrane protein insertase YidC [Pseudomonadota bacterium]
MDNIRLLLFFALAFVLLALYQAWQEDYGQPATPVAESVPVGDHDAAVSALPEDMPAAQVAPETPAVPKTPAATASTDTARYVHVTTDILDLKIDTHGGTVASALLRDYPLRLDTPDEKLQLFYPAPPRLFIAQSGLIGTRPESAPNHQAAFVAEAERYDMGDAENLTVTLSWSGEEGVIVNKHFQFTRGSYDLSVEHEVINRGAGAWAGREYRQLQRTEVDEPNQSAFMYTYMGGAIYTPENKYEKISFDDMRDGNLSLDATDGWLAMMQHYFVSAWIPSAGQEEHFYSKVLPGSRFVLGAYSPVVSLESGESHTFSSRLFVGPKLEKHLEQVAQGLNLTRDYGWLAVLAQPMFWVLDQIHTLVGNWGWAIIIFTLLLKLVLYPLSAASYRSMAGMRKLGPRIQAMKDRYGDDKQRMQQAMMDMYRKEKINPLGGCLPLLVQIPFFIALYWVLLESVELRQAPWILWIEDLSVKDPYFVLPILMGVSMVAQQKLNPTPPDPMQAKIMMAMPLIFTVFFAFFPAGLVLYWFVNNLASITQQWHITRQIEQAGSKG